MPDRPTPVPPAPEPAPTDRTPVAGPADRAIRRNCSDASAGCSPSGSPDPTHQREGTHEPH